MAYKGISSGITGSSEEETDAVASAERITGKEREWLRELAKKQQEYAALPMMRERERLWYLHNALKGERPLVVMEEDTFLSDILPPARCESPLAKRIETQLQRCIVPHELFDDDKVVPAYFPVYNEISVDYLGQKLERVYASTGPGFHIVPCFETLEEGLIKLRLSDYIFDGEATADYEKAAQDVLGDILPVVRKTSWLWWEFGITQWIVRLMGMENMLVAIAVEGDDFHRLMRLVTDDLIACLGWLEKNGLLVPNNGNDYMGSGSFNFTHELPGEEKAGAITSREIWGHLDSQESVGLSPAMYTEFIYPYYAELAAYFGLVYYGCCEPVHAIWDKCLKNLPNMRKVSISPWCDEAIMGERLRDASAIYSRKPSPNLIGVKKEFDTAAFTAYIKKTAELTRGGCKVEFIFRDIYKLDGNLEKTRQAVDITRHIAESMY
jgi:hypothetical protein